MFIKMKEEIEEQISKLEISKEVYKGADKNLKQAVVTAFHIASEAYEIFIVRKHDLIEFVFSKLTLRGKKLEYTLRCPFDLMVNLSDCADWLPALGALRTNYHEAKAAINRPCEYPKLNRAA